MTARRPLVQVSGKMKELPSADTLPATVIPNIYFPSAYTGTVDASDYVFALVTPVAFNLPSGMTGSVAKAKTASTGTATFDVKKNGTNIGTLTFTSSATGVFALASQTSFAVGDLLEIVGPASADATLADLRVVVAAIQTA